MQKTHVGLRVILNKAFFSATSSDRKDPTDYPAICAMIVFHFYRALIASNCSLIGCLHHYCFVYAFAGVAF